MAANDRGSRPARTMSDVAAEAGVSTATVSRVLTGAVAVAPATAAHVLKAVADLGYRPNAVARSLRVERTRTLGLVIGDVLNPFFTELSRAVEDAARERGYLLIVGNADEDARRQDNYVNILLDRRVDGLLVTPALGAASVLREAVRFGAAIVFVDRGIADIDAPIVRADGARAIDQLIGHLAALGHTRIALISGPRDLTTGAERLSAFRAALAARSLALPEGYLQFGDFRMESGTVAMQRLLELDPVPTAVFAADNLMALGAIRTLRRRGLRIGADIALASFDDLPWFDLLEPPMTAIAQPTAALGRAAVEAVLALLDGKRARSRTLPCRLVVRGSCGESK